MTDEESYFLVYYLWLACTIHALAESDLMIDTRLSDKPHYAPRLSEQIAHATGLRINLSDMRGGGAAHRFAALDAGADRALSGGAFLLRGSAENAGFQASFGVALPLATATGSPPPSKGRRLAGISAKTAVKRPLSLR